MRINSGSMRFALCLDWKLPVCYLDELLPVTQELQKATLVTVAMEVKVPPNGCITTGCSITHPRFCFIWKLLRIHLACGPQSVWVSVRHLRILEVQAVSQSPRQLSYSKPAIPILWPTCLGLCWDTEINIHSDWWHLPGLQFSEMSLNFSVFPLLLDPRVQDTGLALQRCSSESCLMITLKTASPHAPG